MNQEDIFNITVVAPNSTEPEPVWIGHRLPDGCYSPAGSSAGSSTPETPHKPLLDLNFVNVYFQAGADTPAFFDQGQHRVFSSEGASSFSQGGLSPVMQSLGSLSLSEGASSPIDPGARAPSVGYEDSSQVFGEIPRQHGMHLASESPCPSPARQGLSPLIIPQPLQARGQSALYDISGHPSELQFMSTLFNFPDDRETPSSSIESLSPPSTSHSEPSSLPSSSWSSSPPSNMNMAHTLIFNTMDQKVYRPQAVGGSSLHRRNTHSEGGMGGFMGGPSPGRGRQDERAPPSSSSSRRSSPYPSPHPTPGLSSSSLSPHSAIDPVHLTVPERDVFPRAGDGIKRRHSFTQTGRPVETQFLTYTETSPPLPPADPTERPIRKVASQAGIKASEARRTKEARFVCILCDQTFTTNHNLKNHVNVHLGFKDHICTRCNRNFTTQSVLQRHLKTCKAPEPAAPF